MQRSGWEDSECRRNSCCCRPNREDSLRARHGQHVRLTATSFALLASRLFEIGEGFVGVGDVDQRRRRAFSEHRNGNGETAFFRPHDMPEKRWPIGKWRAWSRCAKSATVPLSCWPNGVPAAVSGCARNQQRGIMCSVPVGIVAVEYVSARRAIRTNFVVLDQRAPLPAPGSSGNGAFAAARQGGPF